MCVQPCLLREFVSMHVSLFLSFSRRGPAQSIVTLANEASNALGRDSGRRILYLHLNPKPISDLCSQHFYASTFKTGDPDKQ